MHRAADPKQKAQRFRDYGQKSTRARQDNIRLFICLLLKIKDHLVI